MINKRNEFWKEAVQYDKMQQQKGFRPLSETELLATAQHFEGVAKDARAAMARNIAKRKELDITDEEIFG